MSDIFKKSETIDLSVVIINWRQRFHLDKCLPSIFEKRFSCSFEIILVNKPSEDGTEKLVSEKFPQVRLIRHEIFGIAEMRNRGIAEASGRYVMMLDADTEIMEGVFDTLVEFMDAHPDTGGAGSKTIKPDGTLELSCKRFYDLNTIIMRRTPLHKIFPNNVYEARHLMRDKNHDESFEIDWMAGASYLMRRKTIEQVGVFDEHYYFGFEDVDWCFRAKKSGWKIRYIPDAIIVHHVQRSSAKGFNKMAVEHLKSGIRFWRKHYAPSFLKISEKIK